MTKADRNPTTRRPRRSVRPVTTTPPAVLPASPRTPADIGAEIATLDAANVALDRRCLREKGETHRRLDKLMTLADDRRCALCELALTLPAVSLADAATLTSLVLGRLLHDSATITDEADDAATFRYVERALLAVLGALETAGCVKLEDVGAGEWRPWIARQSHAAEGGAA